MRIPETLETERLILRRPRASDAEAVFEEYARDSEVTRYLAWRPHQTLTDTKAFLKRAAAGWSSGERYGWVLTLKGRDRPIGMLSCGIQTDQAGLAYVLGRNHWGEGIMSEAVEALVEWLLDQPPIHRVWAVCDTTHEASARVLEKAGMRRERVLPRLVVHPNLSPEPRDCYLYSRVGDAA